MKKYILTFSLLFSSCLLAEEQSVFGAGDLNSANPYGLSESEKHILKNKDSISDLNKKVLTNDVNIKTLEEKLEGLRSVVEGQNQLIIDFKSQMMELKNSAGSSDKLENIENDVSLMTVDINNSFASLAEAIDKITKVVNTINSNYIPKDDLNAHLKKEFDRFQKEILKELSSQPKTLTPTQTNKQSIDLSKEDSNKIMADAKNFFDTKKFEEAKIRYSILIERNHKSAASNYFLGEIAYNQNKYSEALDFYKKSVGLYDKSSFMPNLLLHSALSCEKIKDAPNAKNFYNALISGYADTKEAKTAQENLKKLK